MRFGITILPEHRWSDAEPLWRRAEEYGFDHAWTYDHLVWAGLPDSPWFGAAADPDGGGHWSPTIRLGTFVSSPNYRHPSRFLRDLLALDDISGGRLICGLGTGGDLDSRILGEDDTVKERVDRFHEFVELLDRLLREDHVDHAGDALPCGRRAHPARAGAAAPGAVRHRGQRAAVAARSRPSTARAG